ncbi:hypothetical protein MASR2M78_22560 [Treponema sp.]
MTIRESGGLFEANGDKVKLSEALETLFSLGKKEYSSFVRGDQMIERLRFSGKPFADALTLILDQVNAEYAADCGSSVYTADPADRSPEEIEGRRDSVEALQPALHTCPLEISRPSSRRRSPDRNHRPSSGRDEL